MKDALAHAERNKGIGWHLVAGAWQRYADSPTTNLPGLRSTG